MIMKKKMVHKEEKHRSSTSLSEEESIRKQPEKIGWFRKLLDWISKGAAESSMGTMDCPT